MKDRFVRLQVKESVSGDYLTRIVKAALYNAWENGASTALFAPNWAYSEIAEERREAYARFVLGAMALNDYRDLHGRDPTADEYTEALDAMIEREKEIPSYVCILTSRNIHPWAVQKLRR